MKTLLIFFALLITSVNIMAQKSDSGRNSERGFGLILGYQNRQLLDEQKSALTYGSREYLAGITFERNAIQSVISASASLSIGNFTSKHFRNRWLYVSQYDIYGNKQIDSFPVMSGIISGSLQITYLRKLKNTGTFQWLVGTSVKEIMIYPENNIGLLNSLGIYASMGTQIRTGSNGILQSSVSLPLIALNSRLPWHNTSTAPLDSEIKTFFKKGSRWVGPEQFRMIQLDVKYDMSISSRLSFRAGYTFTWLHVTYYQPLKSYINNFQIQTTYNF